MDIEPKENSELLVFNRDQNNLNNIESNGNIIYHKDSTRDPTDGGFRAYSVLIASFLTNGLLFGVINSYSVIIEVLEPQLTNAGVPNSKSRASLVGSLTMGTTFFFSPLSGVLTSLLGLRLTALLGGSIATLGLVISSFVTFNVDALCFTYGILYGVGASLAYTPSLAILGHYYKKYLALVGSLTMGTTFFFSPLSGVLTSLLGLRLTALLGGSIATLGLVISSFVTFNVDALCFTYGILYGVGASLAYTPSLAILGHYYKKYLGIANGIVTIGSSVFTVIMPIIMTYVLKNYGLDWLFRVLAALTFGIALCGLLFKPVPLMFIEKPPREKNNFISFIKHIVDVQIWKKKKYKLWALFMPVALFGYFVPYVYLKELIKTNVPSISDSQSKLNLPLQCIGATSGVGRLLFGFLADKSKVDRILLQQISFYVIGTLTIVLPFVKSFEVFILVSLGMGLFDGAFIALIGPIAFELCGGACAAQAIGCMLGMAATPIILGPPIAGYIFSLVHSYTLPFVLAGISPIVGATLMFTTRYYGQSQPSAIVSNDALGSLTVENGKPNEFEEVIPLAEKGKIIQL